jgi:hypothetical protein
LTITVGSKLDFEVGLLQATSEQAIQYGFPGDQVVHSQDVHFFEVGGRHIGDDFEAVDRYVHSVDRLLLGAGQSVQGLAG